MRPPRAGPHCGPMALVLAMSVFVAVAAFTVDALRIGAPGAFLPLLDGDRVGIAAAGVPVGHVVAWTAVGAATAVPIAMSGCLLRPRTPERAAMAEGDRGGRCLRPRSGIGGAAARSRRGRPRGMAVSARRRHRRRDHPHTRDLLAAQDRCVSLLHGSAAISRCRRRGSVATSPCPAPDHPIPARPGGTPAGPVGAHRRAPAHVSHAPAAGALAMVLGVARPDWAVITAAMILHQGPDRSFRSFQPCTASREPCWAW